MIRWIVRLLMLGMLGLGLLLAVIYPWAARTQTGYEIGRVPVLDRLADREPVEIALDLAEDQVRVAVEIVISGSGDDPQHDDLLEVTVSRQGRTELARVLALSDAQPRLVSPQSRDSLYGLEVGTLHLIKSEPYVFTFLPREGAAAIRSAELVLAGGFYDYDESVPPIGFGLIAIGFVGMALTFRRRRDNPNSQPPPRWGRR